MIKVLQNWQEILSAKQEIQSLNLPLHLDVHKNWDHLLLKQAIETSARHSLIVDLGCGDCCTLDFLTALGFDNLHGVDLKIKQPEGLPYTLHQEDISKTSFLTSSCDIVVSISVIEHGVNFTSFFAEVSRLLKPQGLLFLTTDYWEEHIDVDNRIQPFGLDWKVFCQTDVVQLINVAQEHNLVLEKYRGIPNCVDKPINWNNYRYTFLALLFRKVTNTDR